MFSMKLHDLASFIQFKQLQRGCKEVWPSDCTITYSSILADVSGKSIWEQVKCILWELRH